MNHSNMNSGDINEQQYNEAIDALIAKAKENEGKRIENPVRDNAFGAVGQMVDEYRRNNQ